MTEQPQAFNEIAERLAELLCREAPEPGTLYIVGTPIGNMGDISPRALGILAGADLVAAEDTRRSRELLSYFSIRSHFISYHAHNEQGRGRELLDELQAGKSIALVTDAGMPAVSDPGRQLVDLCLKENIPVKVIPGPSAAIAALALSGLESEDFRFIGFLPVKGKARSEKLKALKDYDGTSILYEAPHRLLKTLEDLERAGFASREAAAARELTKQYEEIRRGSLTELLSHFRAEPPRGEFVLLLGPPGEEEKKQAEKAAVQSLSEQIRAAIARGASDKDIIHELGESSGLAKNALKRLIGELRRG